jgi:UDPglucose--hexose-1-phosphate uridylyltransferase
MGDLRKDYVIDRFVIVSQDNHNATDSKKCPYCPGNESMTNPSSLSLVAKDGMLQRLQDTEDYYVEN